MNYTTHLNQLSSFIKAWFVEYKKHTNYYKSYIKEYNFNNTNNTKKLPFTGLRFKLYIVLKAMSVFFLLM